MAKHNIDAIAHAVIAAHAAYTHHNQAIAPAADDPADCTPTPELLAAVRVRVLEHIHGMPLEDDEAPVEKRRADRLFAGIVKALTVRL